VLWPWQKRLKIIIRSFRFVSLVRISVLYQRKFWRIIMLILFCSMKASMPCTIFSKAIWVTSCNISRGLDIKFMERRMSKFLFSIRHRVLFLRKGWIMICQAMLGICCLTRKSRSTFIAHIFGMRNLIIRSVHPLPRFIPLLVVITDVTFA